MTEKTLIRIGEGGGNISSGRDNSADRRVGLADQPISEEELESLLSAVVSGNGDNIYPKLTVNELDY